MRTFARNIFTIVAAVAAIILIFNTTNAQQKIVRISQAASVSQMIGLTDISVAYHRPGVKGREIWGKLLPYDQVWRAGANEATTLNFSDDVTIAGKQLKAGTYSFFVIPRQGEWTVIFNSQPKQWGAFSYDSTKDVLKFLVKPESASHEEWLSYSFSDLSINSAKFSLRWEKIALSFTIEVNTDANVASANNTAVTTAWQQLNSYARYCLDSKTNWDKGMEAVERSIDINENTGNLRTKAELLAQAGKTKDAMEAIEKSIAINENVGNLRTKAEILVQAGKAKDAIAVGEKAIKVGKAANPTFDPSALEKLIEEWKKK